MMQPKSVCGHCDGGVVPEGVKNGCIEWKRCPLCPHVEELIASARGSVVAGSFLLTAHPIAIRDNPQVGPDRLSVIPAGTLELFDDDSVVIMDEKAAEAVIANFAERGVNVPIDYEHSTMFKAGKGEASIAAGWITALEWSPTDGLIATVEWNARAKQQIKDGEYRYLSPHLFTNPETRRVDWLMAVALTNTPKIKNMRELVAASVAAANAGLSNGEHTMLKKNRARLCSVLSLKDEATDEEIIAQVEEVAVQDPDNPENPEEVSAEDQAVIAVKGLLMEMQRALMEANVIGADSSLADAMQAALDLIGKPKEEGAEEAAASIACALGMAKGKKHTTAEIVASITAKIATTVPAAELKSMQEQVASLTAEKKDREATEIVGSLVSAGKLNPYDEDKMKWAREQARTNTEQFCSLMENAPETYKGDRETPEDPAHKTSREVLIASALQDHKNEPCSGAAKFYVNAALDEEGKDALTEAEIKTHAIA